MVKPRTRGITEIRGPYYTPMGPRYLEDILETMGAYVDSLKFAGGSFTLMPRAALTQIIELAHRHDVLVSTGGFIEYVVTQGKDAVDAYIRRGSATARTWWASLTPTRSVPTTPAASAAACPYSTTSTR